MATQFPASSPAPWGIAAAETGIILDSISHNTSDSEKLLLGVDGSPVAISLYGEKMEGTMSGYIPGSTPFSGTIATALTLVTTPADYLKGSASALTICRTVGSTSTTEDYRKLEISFVNYPGITA